MNERIGHKAKPQAEPQVDLQVEPQVDPLWKRLMWFGALWAAGVATVATISYAIRIWLVD